VWKDNEFWIHYYLHGTDNWNGTWKLEVPKTKGMREMEVIVYPKFIDNPNTI